MLDRGTFWAPALRAEAEAEAGLLGDGLQVRVLPTLPQVMVSGDLEAGLGRFGVSQSLGLMGTAAGARYALRLARGRALVVGADLPAAACGWAEGVALTPMTGALAVLEITGARVEELLARATAIDLTKSSPCAALQFAGVTSILYRYEGGVRLHFDRGLVSYMLDWMATSGAF